MGVGKSLGCWSRVQRPRHRGNLGKLLKQVMKYMKIKGSDNEVLWSEVGQPQNQLRVKHRLLK